MRGFIAIVFFCLISGSIFSQKTELDNFLIAKDTLVYKTIDPLGPAKAAFFSAILPGLGQAYNKKYWKIPIVYGGLITSLYFYSDNNTKYNEFRTIYKRRLEGFTDDKFQGVYSDNVLINAQRTFQRNRSISLLVTLGIYILNIVDANVDAHMIQFNVSNNLSLQPDFTPNDRTNQYTIGLTLNYSFK